MKIQSLSIAVPGKNCINNCKFCVSRMHCEEYKNRIDTMDATYTAALHEYLAKLNYARDNGCNSLMLTGNCEPQQNRNFLKTFGFILRMMDNPFRQIEMQTTGVQLDEDYLLFLRDWVKLTTISLSVSSFDNRRNNEIINSKTWTDIILEDLCDMIVKLNLNLRLSVNLTDEFSSRSLTEICNQASRLGANQVTLRKMYSNNTDTPQAKWIAEHTDLELNRRIHEEIIKYPILRTLEYGCAVRDINGLSVVYDQDCMAKNRDSHTDELKYLILRPDCKLYSSWDSKASLIF